MSISQRFALSRILIVTACMLLSAAVPAQDRWFQVEIIVFQRLSDADLSAESWPPDPGRPSIDESIQLVGAEESPGEESGTFAYRLLNRSHFNLKDSYGGLRVSRGFRPLLHYAWRQPVPSQRRARWVHIYVPPENDAGLTAKAPVIDGTLRVYLSRYLHVEVDLLHQPGGLDTPVRLKTSRRMRSGELHYLDHPLFGLLVLVSPL